MKEVKEKGTDGQATGRSEPPIIPEQSVETGKALTRGRACKDEANNRIPAAIKQYDLAPGELTVDEGAKKSKAKSKKHKAGLGLKKRGYD